MAWTQLRDACREAFDVRPQLRVVHGLFDAALSIGPRIESHGVQTTTPQMPLEAQLDSDNPRILNTSLGCSGGWNELQPGVEDTRPHHID